VVSVKPIFIGELSPKNCENCGFSNTLALNKWQQMQLQVAEPKAFGFGDGAVRRR
jgi:hypothetical protein